MWPESVPDAERTERTWAESGPREQLWTSPGELGVIVWDTWRGTFFGGSTLSLSLSAIFGLSKAASLISFAPRGANSRSNPGRPCGRPLRRRMTTYALKRPRQPRCDDQCRPPKFPRFRINFSRQRLSKVDVGATPAIIRETSPDIGRSWPTMNQGWADSTIVGPKAVAGPRSRHALGQHWPESANFGQTWANFDRCWTNLNQFRPRSTWHGTN